jgi:hypothetical protein
VSAPALAVPALSAPSLASGVDADAGSMFCAVLEKRSMPATAFW